MQKIIADLEDFTLPEKNTDIIKNSDEQEIINQILIVLIDFCNNLTINDTNQEIRREFTKLFNRECRENKLLAKKTDFIMQYQKQLDNNAITKNILLEKLLCKKPSRSISGIISITVVMSPYPHGQKFSCEWNCYYCPNEPAHKGNNWQAQPRSYLYHEPAVRRANRHGFEAYGQMIDRMDTLRANGHEIDKIEIIIEGGTYNSFPKSYLIEFNRDIYYAANTYFDQEKREKKSLTEEVKANRNARVHIIGNCIETRPDTINEDWIRHYRECGVTRIQLGIQSTHNHILKRINRGHTIEQGVDAIEWLKDLCFKIDIHIMPDLPFTTVELDKSMMDYTYQILQPDQIKVYPCAVVPWTIIEKWFNQGKWTPYQPEQLQEVMNYAMTTCPEWIRLPRVIRDIPGVYIQAGNKTTNLRQLISPSREIRSREIERHPEYYNKPACMFVKQYKNNIGAKDYFISYESCDQVALFGFIRLRFPNNKVDNTKTRPIIFKCLKNRALIRELHVYGFNTAVGQNAKASQHRGIGSRLLARAEWIAYFAGYGGIVIISGEGVKNYYKKRGYYEMETFMVKDFIINIKLVIFIIVNLILILSALFITSLDV